MTNSKIFLVRSILGMCAISFLLMGCKKAPTGSRGGNAEPEPAPSEAVPHVPDPAEIIPHVPDPAEIVPHVPDPAEIE